MMNNKQKLIKNSDIIFDEIDEGGMLLYNNQTHETHILNETAALVFSCCNGDEIDSVLAKYLKSFEINSCDFDMQNKIIQEFYEVIEIMKSRHIILK